MHNSYIWFLCFTEKQGKTWSSKPCDPKTSDINLFDYDKSILLPICKYTPKIFIPYILKWKINKILCPCKQIKFEK